MPMVNGMSFPYTEKGKKEAKMAALGKKKKKSSGMKKGFSGVKSQVYGG
jgi:hypothetical protein